MLFVNLRSDLVSLKTLCEIGGYAGNLLNVDRRGPNDLQQDWVAIVFVIRGFDSTLGYPGEGPLDDLLDSFAHVRQMVDQSAALNCQRRAEALFLTAPPSLAATFDHGFVTP